MDSLYPIRYIGVDDDNIDLFEAQYPVPEGISYNSYLIDDQHPAIIDSVDIRRCADWLNNIADTGITPHYIIVQHAEPDHLGSLEALIQKYPDIKIICSRKCATMIPMFFENLDLESRVHTVADGDTLSLGHTTLKFVAAPMVHWPEVIMTYDATDRVLFSADAFGTFAQWDSQGPWDDEARRYYSNIVGRYGTSVQLVLKKLLLPPITTIAPLHGPMLSGDLSHYVDLYEKWSRYQPELEGTLVAYASIYGGTAEAARRLGAMLRPGGPVVMFDLCRHDLSYAVAQAFRLSRIVLACSTYDGGLFPSMQTFLHHLAGKHLANRKVAIIENGAWAPMAAKLITDHLSHMRNMTIVAPTLTLHGRLHQSDLPTLQSLAQALLQSD